MTEASKRRFSFSDIVMPVLAIVLAVAAVGVDVGMSVAAGDSAHAGTYRQSMGP